MYKYLHDHASNGNCEVSLVKNLNFSKSIVRIVLNFSNPFILFTLFHCHLVIIDVAFQKEWLSL